MGVADVSMPEGGQCVVTEALSVAFSSIYYKTRLRDGFAVVGVHVSLWTDDI